MKKTSRRKVATTGDNRQSVVGGTAAPKSRPMKFGRQTIHQRVEIAALTMRGLKALTNLVNLGLAAHRASGAPVSRSMQEAVYALRSPRSGRLLQLQGARVTEVGGLVVRLEPTTGRVYLQAMEAAGDLTRPNSARFWMLEPNEVDGVARALCQIAGLSPEVPPYCLAAHRGIDCRVGEVLDQKAYDQQLTADAVSLRQEADAICREVFAPQPADTPAAEYSADA